MGEGRRVFTDATHSSIRGCKNSIARLATESRAAWALENEEETKPAERSIYKRRYRWNERNLMQESSDNTQSVHYRYGQDGQRALKSSNQSETLYFNTMWSWLHNSSAYNTDRESKHIYLGTERLVTRMNGAGTQGNAYTAQVSTYYYHSDHLGSAQLITDNEGREYERIEYTPYGEYWVEKIYSDSTLLSLFSTSFAAQNSVSNRKVAAFTGKERDEETGLYYYGARYMDPRTSRWLSTDPALTDYIPMAPVDDNARKHNQNLPGMGGIYNSINMHLYHYAGNNPVKYTDPDGKSTDAAVMGEAIVAGAPVAEGVAVATGVTFSQVLLAGACIFFPFLITGDSISQNSQDADTAKTPDIPSPLAPEVPKPDEGTEGQDENVIPTPEELEHDIQDKQNEINNSYATTETPWVPNDLQPPGKEPPPGVGPKILWTVGKILELLDNLKGN